MAERIAFFYRLFSQCYICTILIGLGFTAYLSVDFIRHRITVDLKASFDHDIPCRHCEIPLAIPAIKCITFPLWFFSQRYCTSIFIGFCTAILDSIYLIRYGIAVDSKASFDHNIFCRHQEIFTVIPMAKCIPFLCRLGFQPD